MVKTYVIPDMSIIPGLLDTNSEEYRVFSDALAKGITFYQIPDFTVSIKSSIRKKVLNNLWTEEQGLKETNKIMSQIKIDDVRYYAFAAKAEDMGLDPDEADLIGLYLSLKTCILWCKEIPKKYKTLIDQFKILDTADFKKWLSESYSVMRVGGSTSTQNQSQELKDSESEYEEDQEIENEEDQEIEYEKEPELKTKEEIINAYNNIKPVSEPVGFYPGFVKWAVEHEGFLDASDPTHLSEKNNKRIKITDLPKYKTMKAVRFISFFEVSESDQIAYMEIIESKINPSIPYWGLFVSLKRIKYGIDREQKPYYDYTFFRNTLKVPTISGYYIFGSKGEDFKHYGKIWKDRESLQKEFGIVLGKLREGDLLTYVQIIFKGNSNTTPSITLGLKNLHKICNLADWTKKIGNLNIPTGGNSSDMGCNGS